MQKRIFSLFLAILLACFSLIGLTSCDDDKPQKAEPQKLSAPVVILQGDVASWQANGNADKFEISLDGTLSYVENSVTSKKITDGQTFKVRAVGNGNTYKTSDWSNSVTCHMPTSAPTEPTVAPTTVPTEPTVAPTVAPTVEPTVAPTVAPTVEPTIAPTSTPTEPTAEPTAELTKPTEPTAEPTKPTEPTEEPTKPTEPTAEPTKPTEKPTKPTEKPTDEEPTKEQTSEPMGEQPTESEPTDEEATEPSSGTEPTVAPETPKDAPQYLGILASKYEPSALEGMPEGITALYAPLRLLANDFSLGDGGAYVDASLSEYFANESNHLGEDYPSASEYDLYSAVDRTVFIQIWLNNPMQHTILSLKLNGVKYQAGGALQSFFVKNGDSYLNCVYVAVTIPGGTYESISYEVTELEYVEGANINQNGKAVLIDEDNDTVSIGLPYEKNLPSASIGESTATTATSISFDVNVADEDAYVALIGGWLRVVVQNRSREILAQQKLNVGTNSVTFNGLSAESYYTVSVVLLGDTHDGNGVAPHTISSAEYRTESVISCTAAGETLLNESTGKYYANLSIDAVLSDPSFRFTKIEVGTWDEVFYTADFDGSIDITDGILNGNDYTVKVYYENALGVEQFYTDYVYVESLDYPWFGLDLQFGLIDDAILGFNYEDRKFNLDNVKIQIFDTNSKQYVAENALYLMDHPNAIEELQEQWNSMSYTDPEYNTVYFRIQELRRTKETVEDYYASVTRQEWEEELAKGIYIYEYVLGEDDQFFKGAKSFYYVVLEDYQSKRVNDSSWQYVLSADIDENNGEAAENRTLAEGWFGVEPAIGKKDYLFVASDEDYNDLFTLDENNVLYLEVMSRNNLGNESYRNLGYVNQIVIAKGYDILHVLWTQDEPDHEIDEAAWLSAVKEVLIAGGDVNSVFPLGDLQPITFDLDDLAQKPTVAGNFYIRFTYKMYGKEYTEEHPFDWYGGVIDYTVVGQLPQASISINTEVGDAYGNFGVEIPESLENGYWNNYIIEIRDENNQLIGTYNQDNYYEAGRLSVNYSVRVKLTAIDYIDYYVDGEWSEWFVCEPAQCEMPSGFYTTYEADGVKLEWQWVNGAEKYVYVINGGTEQETYEMAIYGLKDGDTVKVKAIPASDSQYLESDYCELYVIEDPRTVLDTPTNLYVQDKALFWNEVNGATYYLVEYTSSAGTYTQTTDSADFGPARSGFSFRVRAMTDDTENYVASAWSAEYSYTEKLASPTFRSSDETTVRWRGVSYAKIYYYKIGENGEVQTASGTSVELSEIPLGEKLYVQATADGYESSDWAMIYHNVKTLATPEVTVTGGIATWTAIDGAEGYLYKINDGVETATTNLSLSGLSVGDTVTVCATSSQNGYANSEWSEVKTQLPTLSAPVLNDSDFITTHTVSWNHINGATSYIYELDGTEYEFDNYSVENLEFGMKIRVRAICASGEYEYYGEWSELLVLEDTREQLATPTIAYAPEKGLTVVVNDPKVSHYEVMFGQGGYQMSYYPSDLPEGVYETEAVITNSFAFPDGNGGTVYVKAVPKDSTLYRDSEWATQEIVFNFE